jgi:hypothetical protein
LSRQPLNGTGKQSSEKVVSPPEDRLSYCVNINAHLGKSLWQVLINRGADGDIMGNDCRIIARTGKYIDLCCVDDHAVSNLELVTAGAKVITQNGPIIIIVN